MCRHHHFLFFFFFNDTATTEIYTLSLHDALPISIRDWRCGSGGRRVGGPASRGESMLVAGAAVGAHRQRLRSGEHTSELQSLAYLVCRLLLVKKKNVKSHVFDANR